MTSEWISVITVAVTLVIAVGGWCVAIASRRAQTGSELAQAEAEAARNKVAAEAESARIKVQATADFEKERLARSGSVASSQADDLWEESKAMRAELRHELLERDVRIDKLEASLKEVQLKCMECERREQHLVEKLADAIARMAAAGL